MEPISGIETVQKERWELSCCICRQRMGAKIQCNNCYTAFHPLCGRYRSMGCLERHTLHLIIMF